MKLDKSWANFYLKKFFYELNVVKNTKYLGYFVRLFFSWNLEFLNFQYVKIY